MVCSNCKQEGHTKPKCKNPAYVSPPESVEEDISTPILLTEEVRRKFSGLAQLCKEVAGDLRKGQVEGVYQQALIMELQEAGVRYVSEETMPILYKGRPVGGGHSQRLDVLLLSYLPFIFELKAVSKPISSEHHWQLVRYLDYKKQPYGAVVNFNQSDKGSLEIQFIVKQDDVFYLYDLESSSGIELSDFSLVKTADEWGWD
jgi:GxxExxY protein